METCYFIVYTGDLRSFLGIPTCINIVKTLVAVKATKMPTNVEQAASAAVPYYDTSDFVLVEEIKNLNKVDILSFNDIVQLNLS